MGNIDKILKETLNERYRLNESFKNIYKNKDYNVRFNSTINQFGKLIDEGYDNDQINNVVEEQFDWLKKLFYAPGKTKGDTTGEKIISTAEHGAIAQFQEFLIRNLLKTLGFEGPLANAVSAALSELNITALIGMFRGEYDCQTNGTLIANALTDALIEYVVETNTKENSMDNNFLRKTFMQYLKSEGYTKQMGKFLCSAFTKLKPSIPSISSIGSLI